MKSDKAGKDYALVNLINVLKKISCDFIRSSKKYNLSIKTRNYNSIYGYYLRYQQQLDDEKREKILEAIIKKVQHYTDSLVEEKPKLFSQMYPDHDKTLREFKNWIKENRYSDLDENDVLRIFTQQDENIDAIKIVKEVFREKLPELKLCDNKKVKTTLNYEIDLADDGQFIVMVDFGYKRGWLHFFIGLKESDILFDVYKIFSLNKRAFDFLNDYEAKTVANNAAEMIKIILEKNREIDGLKDSRA